MTSVVPPAMAAFVPVSKSSAVTVPATSRSKCVCPSIKPGKRSFPLTSITCASSSSRFCPVFTMVSPSIRTSSLTDRSPDTTVPFFNKYFTVFPPFILPDLYNKNPAGILRSNFLLHKIYHDFRSTSTFSENIHKFF